MIEILSGISLFLGLVIKGAAVIFLICVIGLGIFYFIKMTPDSACHGNCNQGRTCDCKGDKNGTS